MSHLVVILGATGSGKSTSIKNLNPQETVVLALKAVDKDLPFKGSRKMYNAANKNYFALKDYSEILTYMESISKNLTNVKNIVLEDATYIMRTEFFDRSAEKGYDKYNELADHFRKIIAKGTSLRSDINVFMFLHTDTVEEDGNIVGYKASTVGKLLDKMYNPLESVTITLFCQPQYDDNGIPKYGFYTKRMKVGSVEIPAKTPDGMFEDDFIPNDVNLVIEKMNEYYG